MLKYPKLVIDTDAIYDNTKIITKLCNRYDISITGVVKGFGAIPCVSKKMFDGGCSHIASSRIIHLKKIRSIYANIPLMLLRIPMISELYMVVKYSDISLNSEKKTLIELNKESKKQNKVHKVILMRDLGDLREGVFDKIEFCNLAVFVESDLKNIQLLGIGTNLSCYGSIKPSVKNLNKLCESAIDIESKINRKLEIVSGGGTTTLPLVVNGSIPNKINNLRVGEGIINTQDLPLYWDVDIEGLNKDSFVLQAEIIELNEKPTYPIGEMCVNAFGECGHYEDKGVRKRAIIALGNFDISDSSKLIPKDKNIKILGSSSDHTILDIEDSSIRYKVGDIVEFNLLYQPMLFSSASKFVSKKIK